jgi:hypothetical protein
MSSLTFIGIIPIQRVQTDDRELVGNDIDREIRASLEDMIILCRNEVAPDTVDTYEQPKSRDLRLGWHSLGKAVSDGIWSRDQDIVSYSHIQDNVSRPTPSRGTLKVFRYAR